MLKSLIHILRKTLGFAMPGGCPAGVTDESRSIYESLAMTEELREALFPTRPQMVSAIFDRSPPPLVRPPLAPAPSPASDREFTIVP